MLAFVRPGRERGRVANANRLVNMRLAVRVVRQLVDIMILWYTLSHYERMVAMPRVYPPFVKIYFLEPGDVELLNTLKVLSKKTGLSLSFVGLVALERGLPGVEQSLSVLRSRKKTRRSK